MELSRKRAVWLIILFGFISLFGDIVYEGARSVYGPYTKTMHMDIALVGLITGAAEFLGYFIRLVSGYFSDRTKAYWAFTFIGYGMLASVPLLSLTGTWQIAALFIVCERLGKAVRSPAKDTLMSQAAKKIGTGWGFGLHEAMDQVGALSGPLIFTGLFLVHGERGIVLSDYQRGFAWLWIPFILVMACVYAAWKKVPDPGAFETETAGIPVSEKLSKTFWIYTAFTFTTTLGFITFVILGYHYKEKELLSDAQIPLFYSIAMGVDALAALAIGKIYDRLKKRHNNDHAGLMSLIIIPVLTLFIPIFVFMNETHFIIIGVVIWGIVMGAHETIMKSSIADITHIKKRGLGYGIFNAVYGIAMFLGSSLFGILYTIDIRYITMTIIILQAVSMTVYFALYRSIKSELPSPLPQL